MTEQKTFGELEIGARFTWLDVTYIKIAYDYRARYGHVNMRGPSFYKGDTGHRHLTDDVVVEVQS